MVSNLPLSFIDTHCHLNLNDFDEDRLQVIERARRSGIFKIFVPGITLATSKSAIDLSHTFPEVFAAVGVHPNSATTWQGDSLYELRQLAGQSKVMAIGEIGLDYYRSYAPRELQRKIFLEQLNLAAELDLPVIIHNRDATGDMIGILQEWYCQLENLETRLKQFPGVLHSFSSDLTTAKTMLALNFKIGITGPVTFKNAIELQSIVDDLSLENLLIETDAPYLTPLPYRGQRNEPANVRIVAEKIAEIKRVPVELVAKITTESANQLFDWRIVH